MSQPQLPRPQRRTTSRGAARAKGSLHIGPLNIPTGAVAQTAGSVGSAAQRGLEGVRHTAVNLTHRLRHPSPRRQAPVRGRRPDGTLVAPSPSATTTVVVRSTRSARTGLVTRVMAPVTGARAALRVRWDDALREGRLAARDKETEIRAEYERRVRHDPRLHALQHNRKQD